MASARFKQSGRAVAGLAAVAVFLALTWLAVDRLRERQTERRTEALVQEIVGLLDLAEAREFHARLDKVRTFINDNSDHKIDDEFWANRGNPAAYAAGVVAHAKGLSSDPVNMECSTRANLMGRVLRALGYETRVVAIF